ncbi:MAG: hypothetical protein Q9163_000286 [Psora crenata]
MVDHEWLGRFRIALGVVMTLNSTITDTALIVTMGVLFGFGLFLLTMSAISLLGIIFGSGHRNPRKSAHTLLVYSYVILAMEYVVVWMIIALGTFLPCGLPTDGNDSAPANPNDAETGFAGTDSGRLGSSIPSENVSKQGTVAGQKASEAQADLAEARLGASEKSGTVNPPPVYA